MKSAATAVSSRIRSLGALSGSARVADSPSLTASAYASHDKAQRVAATKAHAEVHASKMRVAFEYKQAHEGEQAIVAEAKARARKVKEGRLDKNDDGFLLDKCIAEAAEEALFAAEMAQQSIKRLQEEGGRAPDDETILAHQREYLAAVAEVNKVRKANGFGGRRHSPSVQSIATRGAPTTDQPAGRIALGSQLEQKLEAIERQSQRRLKLITAARLSRLGKSTDVNRDRPAQSRLTLFFALTFAGKARSALRSATLKGRSKDAVSDPSRVEPTTEEGRRAANTHNGSRLKSTTRALRGARELTGKAAKNGGTGARVHPSAVDDLTVEDLAEDPMVAFESETPLEKATM
jgi:hypothetical protein